MLESLGCGPNHILQGSASRARRPAATVSAFVSAAAVPAKARILRCFREWVRGSGLTAAANRQPMPLASLPQAAQPMESRW
jgi:hypothetical protein